MSVASAAMWSFDRTWTTSLGAFNAHLNQSVGDLDGDGCNEILIAQSYSQPDYESRDFFGFLVLARDAQDMWRMRDLSFRHGYLHAPPLFDAGPTQRAFVAASEEGPDGNSASYLDVYAGLPLRRVQRMPVEGVAIPYAIADIDGNGTQDMLVVDGQPYRLRLRDLDTLTIVREYDLFHFIALAQLDDDPALELIGNNNDGLVLDGATGEAEWHYTGSFDDGLLAGEFDANPDTREFAAVRFEDVVVFGANPYAPLKTYPLPCDTRGLPAVIEADGDAGSEIAFQCETHIAISDLQNGPLRDIAMGEAYGGSTLAQLDDDPATELLINRFSTPLKSALIVDSVTDEHQFRLDEVNDGPLPSAAGAFSGDGREEIAVLTAGPSVRDPATAWILDPASGDVLRSARVETVLDWQQRPVSVAVGQLDDDPALELVFGASDRVVALDGATLEPEWETGSTFSWSVGGVAIADIDGDDEMDIVVDSDRTAVVLARDGTLQWETPRADSSIVVTLAQADNDPALELLLSHETTVRAFDGQTRLEEWSATFPSTWYERLLVSEGHEGCLMLAYRSDGTAAEARCGDDPAWSEFSFGTRLHWLGSLPGRSDLLLAVRDYRLALVTRRGELVVDAPFVAPSWGMGANSLHVTSTPGPAGDAYRVIAGGEGAVWNIRISLPTPFGDGFESNVAAGDFGGVSRAASSSASAR